MQNEELILIVGAERETREKVIATTHKCGLGAVSCLTLDDARSQLAQKPFSLIFCSDVLPDGGYRELLRAASPIPVIVLSRLAEWEPCIVAIRAGAFDYIACPLDPVETERILSCALRESSRIRRAVQIAA